MASPTCVTPSRPPIEAWMVLTVLLALCLPCAASAQLRPSVATGTLRIIVPAGLYLDHYWVYVDGKMVASPPYGDSPWSNPKEVHFGPRSGAQMEINLGGSGPVAFIQDDSLH